MRKSRIMAILAGCIMLAGIIGVVVQPQASLTTTPYNPLDMLKITYETERKKGFYSLKDEDGRIIHQTALPVYVGDEYIAEDNKRYRVNRIEGDDAFAKFMGVEHLAYNPAWDEPTSINTATGKNKGKLFGVYHTHSAESYVPTDGKSSIYGKGTIMKVGLAYAQALKGDGQNVIHSTRPHDPHDANAYHRSRRTAMELMRQGADVLVDVHRDAVPPDVYAKTVEGKKITQVKLVVGRQNPKMGSNMQFARQIKAYADKHRPGLIEGIFIAKGNYNQDISPRAILIEVGAHTNSRERAEAGVKLFSDVIPKVIGAPVSKSGEVAGGTQKRPGQEGTFGVVPGVDRGSWTSVAWILGILVVGGIIFLLVSTGSFKGSMDKVKHFSSKEFANALGVKKKKKDKKNKVPED
ncbi:MAG: stage II sporulation protein P [Thermincolia bacterium]